MQPLEQHVTAVVPRIRRRLVPLFGSGFVAREIRVALPVIIMVVILILAGVASIFVLPLLLGRQQFSWDQARGTVSASISVGVLIIAMILGAYAGGEEIEQGNDEFTRQLPISPPQILARKFFGSFVVFLFGSLLLIACLLSVSLVYSRHLFDSLPGGSMLLTAVSMSFPLYLFVMAASIWLRKVIAGVGVGATLAVTFYFVLTAMIEKSSNSSADSIAHSAPVVSVMLSTLGLFAVWLRFGVERFAPLEIFRLDEFQPLSNLQGHGIYWKELRTHYRMMTVPFIAIFATPLTNLYTHLQWETFLPAVGGAFAFAVLALGATLFDRQESDPSLGGLYSLPIRRRTILRQKLIVLAVHYILLALILVAAFLMSASIYPKTNTYSIGTLRMDAELILLLGIPVSLLAATCGLHLRSALPAILSAALIAACVIGPGVMIYSSYGIPFGVSDRGIVIGAILSLGLILWLFILFTHGWLDELRAYARAGLMLVTALTLIELTLTIWFCDFRELWFLVSGR